MFFSQEELAGALDVSVKAVSRWEQGADGGGMLINTFRRLAELAKVPPDVLRKELEASGSAEAAPVPRPSPPDAKPLGVQYIDGFAGLGRHEQMEALDHLPGPAVASLASLFAERIARDAARSRRQRETARRMFEEMTASKKQNDPAPSAKKPRKAG